MSHSEAGKLSRLSTQQAEINEYARQYRPAIIREEIRECYPVPVKIIEAAVAKNAGLLQRCKPTGRNSGYAV